MSSGGFDGSDLAAGQVAQNADTISRDVVDTVSKVVQQHQADLGIDLGAIENFQVRFSVSQTKARVWTRQCMSTHFFGTDSWGAHLLVLVWALCYPLPTCNWNRKRTCPVWQKVCEAQQRQARCAMTLGGGMLLLLTQNFAIFQSLSVGAWTVTTARTGLCLR